MIEVFKALNGRKRYVVGLEGEIKSDVVREAKKQFHCSDAHLEIKQIEVTIELVIGDHLYQQTKKERKIWVACYK